MVSLVVLLPEDPQENKRSHPFLLNLVVEKDISCPIKKTQNTHHFGGSKKKLSAPGVAHIDW